MRLFLFVIFLISLSACKKDYTCSCKISNSVTNTERVDNQYHYISKSDVEFYRNGCLMQKFQINHHQNSVTQTCEWKIGKI